MADNLTDQEQLQVLKNWWKENGQTIVIAIVLAASAYFAWQWWTQYQKDYADEAFSLYIELTETLDGPDQQALSDEKKRTANFLISQLQDQYGASFYAAAASLLQAKLAADEGELDETETALTRAIALGDDSVDVIARLRLARVHLAQDKLDQALSMATYQNDDEFTGLYAATRGDILLAKGDKPGAQTAYQMALDAFGGDNQLQRRLIEIKLSDLVARD